MNLTNQIRRCEKCGVHFVYSKDSKASVDSKYCHDCKEDKFYSTAVLFAKVIEKMIRE